MTLDEDVEWLLRPDSGPLGGIKEPARPATAEMMQTGSYGLISEPDLADLLGLDARTVRKHGANGVVVKAIKGTRSGPAAYDLEQSIRGYSRWIADRATRHSDDDPLKLEKIRQAKAAAEKLELHNAASRGDLVATADVRAAWGGVMRDVRAGMLAVPARVGAVLPHLSSHDIAQIEIEVRRALEALADD